VVFCQHTHMHVTRAHTSVRLNSDRRTRISMPLFSLSLSRAQSILRSHPLSSNDRHTLIPPTPKRSSSFLFSLKSLKMSHDYFQLQTMAFNFNFPLSSFVGSRKSNGESSWDWLTATRHRGLTSTFKHICTIGDG
jgi:hypothetical protein